MQTIRTPPSDCGDVMHAGYFCRVSIRIGTYYSTINLIKDYFRAFDTEEILIALGVTVVSTSQ
jgi:hypothetical protein